MNQLSEDEIKRRMPVWEAISDLWLDTELGENGVLYIARVLAESGYSLEEIDKIYTEEVAPVVYMNAYSVTGVWTGFDPVWLKEEILKKTKRHFIISDLPIIKQIKIKIITCSVEDNWKSVKNILTQTLNKMP
jgi:hypothetical protein